VTAPVLPFVSVVVPVLNDARRVARCIDALLAQSYPRDRYEVLVVDNGSTDDTRAAIRGRPVTLLVEDRTTGSYAARNKGVRAARGEVIAFTDADCTPVPDWIEQGVRALAAEAADLAGGHVRFVYAAQPSAAEVYDSLTNMQHERNIRERSVAKTANLFVRGAVFAVVGPFPDTMQSGGDVYWTGRATALGRRLVYAPRAEVAHPARRLRELLAKQYRVGQGHYDRYVLEAAAALPRGAHEHAPRHATTPRPFLHSLRPRPLSFIRAGMQRHGLTAGPARLLHVWAVGLLCRLTTALGSAGRWSQYRGSDRRGVPGPATTPPDLA
jgi:GT2 family glycosyltransferase